MASKLVKDTLEAVLVRHDMTRHTQNLRVDGDVAKNDGAGQAFYLDPTVNVAEVRQGFRKVVFGAFIGGAVFPLLYIGMISFLMPTSKMYTYMLGALALAAPFVVIYGFVRALPTVKRRVYGIWGNPVLFDLSDPYRWDEEAFWNQATVIHDRSKATARYAGAKERSADQGPLASGLSWVMIGLLGLIGVVVLVMMVTK